MCAVGAGVGAVIVYIKFCRGRHPPPSQPLSPAPDYEDMELHTTTKIELEIEQNIAYGNVNFK